MGVFPAKKNSSIDLLLVVDLAEKKNPVLSRLPVDRIHGGFISISN